MTPRRGSSFHEVQNILHIHRIGSAASDTKTPPARSESERRSEKKGSGKASARLPSVSEVGDDATPGAKIQGPKISVAVVSPDSDYRKVVALPAAEEVRFVRKRIETELGADALDGVRELFLPFDPLAGGRFLRPDVTLDSLNMRAGGVLQFRKRIHRLKVRLLSHTKKELDVDYTKTAGQILPLVGRRFHVKALDEFSLKYESKWLDLSKTIPEQEVADDSALVLAKKYYFETNDDDHETGAAGAARRRKRGSGFDWLTYVQDRFNVVHGVWPTTREDAARLGALSAQVHLGSFSDASGQRARYDWSRLLPPDHRGSRAARRETLRGHAKMRGMQRKAALVEYHKEVRALQTYSYAFFDVQVKKSRTGPYNRPVLLAIEPNGVHLCNTRTHLPYLSNDMANLRRYAPTSAHVTFDFGGYFTVATSEAEAIADLCDVYMSRVGMRAGSRSGSRAASRAASPALSSRMGIMSVASMENLIQFDTPGRASSAALYNPERAASSQPSSSRPSLEIPVSELSTVSSVPEGRLIHLRVLVWGAQEMRQVEVSSTETVAQLLERAAEGFFPIGMDGRELFMPFSSGYSGGVFLRRSATLDSFGVHDRSVLFLRKAVYNVRVELLDGSHKTIPANLAAPCVGVRHVALTKWGAGEGEHPEFGLAYQGRLLDPTKSLPEQRVPEDGIIVLRKGAFLVGKFDESNIAPGLLDLHFVDARYHVLTETWPCRYDEAIELGALSVVAGFGASATRFDVDLSRMVDENDVVPESMRGDQDFFDEVIEATRALRRVTASAAKARYLNMATRLEAFGLVFFEVTQRPLSGSRTEYCERVLLGISMRGVHVCRPDTKQTFRFLPFSDLKRFAPTATSIVFDFGLGGGFYYTVLTSHSREMTDLIEFYAKQNKKTLVDSAGGKRERRLSEALHAWQKTVEEREEAMGAREQFSASVPGGSPPPLSALSPMSAVSEAGSEASPAAPAAGSSEMATEQAIRDLQAEVEIVTLRMSHLKALDEPSVRARQSMDVARGSGSGGIGGGGGGGAGLASDGCMFAEMRAGDNELSASDDEAVAIGQRGSRLEKLRRRLVSLQTELADKTYQLRGTGGSVPMPVDGIPGSPVTSMGHSVSPPRGAARRRSTLGSGAGSGHSQVEVEDGVSELVLDTREASGMEPLPAASPGDRFATRNISFGAVAGSEPTSRLGPRGSPSPTKPVARPRVYGALTPRGRAKTRASGYVSNSDNSEDDWAPEPPRPRGETVATSVLGSDKPKPHAGLSSGDTSGEDICIPLASLAYCGDAELEGNEAAAKGKSSPAVGLMELDGDTGTEVVAPSHSADEASICVSGVDKAAGAGESAGVARYMKDPCEPSTSAGRGAEASSPESGGADDASQAYVSEADVAAAASTGGAEQLAMADTSVPAFSGVMMASGELQHKRGEAVDASPDDPAPTAATRPPPAECAGWLEPAEPCPPAQSVEALSLRNEACGTGAASLERSVVDAADNVQPDLDTQGNTCDEQIDAAGVQKGFPDEAADSEPSEAAGGGPIEAAPSEATDGGPAEAVGGRPSDATWGVPVEAPDGMPIEDEGGRPSDATDGVPVEAPNGEPSEGVPIEAAVGGSPERAGREPTEAAGGEGILLDGPRDARGSPAASEVAHSEAVSERMRPTTPLAAPGAIVEGKGSGYGWRSPNGRASEEPLLEWSGNSGSRAPSRGSGGRRGSRHVRFASEVDIVAIDESGKTQASAGMLEPVALNTLWVALEDASGSAVESGVADDMMPRRDSGATPRDFQRSLSMSKLIAPLASEVLEGAAPPVLGVGSDRFGSDGSLPTAGKDSRVLARVLSSDPLAPLRGDPSTSGGLR